MPGHQTMVPETTRNSSSTPSEPSMNPPTVTWSLTAGSGVASHAWYPG